MAKITATESNLPSEAKQAALGEWLSQAQRGEAGAPTLLLTGLSADASERWEIGITDAWPHPNNPTQIVLRLPKPANHPESDSPWTDHIFDRETVWLMQAHILYGGQAVIQPSKVGKKRDRPEGWFYFHVNIGGRRWQSNIDRLIGNLRGRHVARHFGDHHDHTRGNILPIPEHKVVEQVGRENERAIERATREGAIGASLSQWRPGLLFPLESSYRAALRDVYAALDRHPMADRQRTPAPPTASTLP